MSMGDIHKFPFSVFAGVKHGRISGEMKRVGGVTDEMDKEIGRPVIRLKGAVSANNYIEVDGLTLQGRFVYIQLKLLRSQIATLHMELLLPSKTPLRITLSTLYQSPKCVGTIIRLPLPVKKGWVCVGIDLDSLIERYSTYSISTSISDNTIKAQRPVMKKIQLCSSMEVREVVTSDKPLTSTKVIILMAFIKDYAQAFDQ